VKLVYLALGIVFGFTLSRSGAADYDYIQKMFMFEDFQLYGILATAVAVIMPGLWLLRRIGKTATGEPLVVRAKPLHAGNVAGGVLFGVGWSITGMCPGPIMVNVGEGKLYALAAFAGALLGTLLLGRAYPVLRPRLRLPEVGPGTG
jgi:uncharacterized protein